MTLRFKGSNQLILCTATRGVEGPEAMITCFRPASFSYW